ncbi:hypothetical protein LXL04_011746 [Taraxacum kok-saghyz]
MRSRRDMRSDASVVTLVDFRGDDLFPLILIRGIQVCIILCYKTKLKTDGLRNYKNVNKMVAAIIGVAFQGEGENINDDYGYKGWVVKMWWLKSFTGDGVGRGRGGEGQSCSSFDFYNAHEQG